MDVSRWLLLLSLCQGGGFIERSQRVGTGKAHVLDTVERERESRGGEKRRVMELIGEWVEIGKFNKLKGKCFNNNLNENLS